MSQDESVVLNQDQETSTSGLPILPKSTIWMINFGFLGVQIAFTLQGSQMSRIFQTIGANPNNLGWFFLLPPLAGLIVQPIIGYYSDRTWAPKLGTLISLHLLSFRPFKPIFVIPSLTTKLFFYTLT